MQVRSGILLVGVLAVASACRSTGRLAEYEFPGRTLAVSFARAPRPDVLTGPDFYGHSRSLAQAVLRAGTTIAREVSAQDARAKLDSANNLVDVAGRMAERTRERAALHLRARPVDDIDDADFILEVNLREYGIDAENWDAAAHFFVEAEVFILDGRDGTQIWKSKVRERDEITPAIFGSGSVRNVVTAVGLASLSVDEMTIALERLADYSADRITNRLRSALEKVQRKR